MEIFQEYLKNFDKVGLSCQFGEPIKASYKFYTDCFKMGWPKKFHSFGWLAEKMLMTYPFHSADASSWTTGPKAYGNWKEYGRMSARGPKVNLVSQIRYYVNMQKQLQHRWKKELAHV